MTGVRSGFNTTVSVPVASLSDAFFPGGRLYIEAFVGVTGWPTTDATSELLHFRPPMPLRVIADDSDWVEPKLKRSIVGAAVGGTVTALVAVGVVALLVVRRRRRLARQAQEEEESMRAGAYAKMKAA